MITIRPLKDKSYLDELNKKNSLNASNAFCLYDGDNVDGYILYGLNEKYGEIIKVDATEEAYIDGLVRAVLASLYDFGIDKAIFSEQVDKDQLKRLSILTVGNEISSIKELIYNCKSCNSAKKCDGCCY